MFKNSILSVLLALLCCSYTFSQKQPADSIIVLQKILESEISDSMRYQTSYRIALQYSQLSLYDSVLKYVDIALSTETSSTPKFLEQTYASQGIAYHYSRQYENAVSTYIKALKVCDEFGVNPVRTYNNISMTYIAMKEWPLAEKYLKKAVVLCKEQNLRRGLSYIYGNLGIVYRNKQELEKAISAYRQSLQIGRDIGDKRGECRNYHNIGILHKEIGALDSAKFYFEKGIQLSKNIDYSHSVCVSLIGLGETLLEQGEIFSAKEALTEAYVIAERLKERKQLQDIHLALSTLYQKQGQYKLAYDNLNAHQQIKDSTISQEHLDKVSELEIAYSSERKDREIATQKLELQESENQLLKKNNQLIMTLIVGSFLLILFIGFYFYFRQRQKARSKEILVLKREQEIIRLEALIKGEEKERYRLARDLHDGINGDLSVIKYKRTSINPELLSEQEKVPHQEAIIMLDNAVEQVRRISHNLAPPSLQNFSLQEAIHQYCSQISSSQSVNIDFQFFGGTVDLKEEYEMAIFRTVQELVNNVVRHSEASEALVQINHRDNQLHITVEDNGTGFDIDDKYSGMGLSNIRSRVDFMNGDLQIDSDSKGTTFNITIDLKNKRNND